jgi:hypothetical protein
VPVRAEVRDGSLPMGPSGDITVAAETRRGGAWRVLVLAGRRLGGRGSAYCREVAEPGVRPRTNGIRRKMYLSWPVLDRPFAMGDGGVARVAV